MKEWKASEKEAQKMTRDGAISVNMVTGEASHVSDRAPEQDYSPSGDSTAFVHSAAERLDDRRIHKSEKKKRRKRRTSDSAFCSLEIALLTSDSDGLVPFITVLASVMAFCSAVRVFSSATLPAELSSVPCACEIAELRFDFSVLVSAVAFEVLTALIALLMASVLSAMSLASFCSSLV